ncbi:hypothetical protein BH11PSE2_BH11PSE2_17290 [soil metagenome]
MGITITTLGAEARVSTTINNNQHFSSSATLSGGYVAVWLDDGLDGSFGGIFFQRFANDGTKLNTELRVNTTTAGTQTAPMVAALAGSGYMVAWEGPAAAGGGVYLQRYTTSGTKVGGEVLVYSSTQTFGFNPAVTALSNGSYVLSWNQQSGDGSGYGVFSQVYNTNNAKVGGVVQVNTTTANQQLGWDGAGLTNGGYVQVWTSVTQAGVALMSQRFDALGGKVGSETIVAPGSNFAGAATPSVASLKGGGYVITWVAGPEVRSQVFDNLGAKVGAELLVDTLVGVSTAPDVTQTLDGGFAIVWSNGGAIYEQYFDALGAARVEPILINTPGTNGANPSIIGLNTGETVISWDQNDGSGDGVYQRKVSAPSIGVATSAVELASGDSADNVFDVSPTTLNAGDIFSGGAGADTLNLTTPGIYDLTQVKLNSVESIKGSGGDDTLIIAPGAPLSGVTQIDLGAGVDTVKLTGAGTVDVTAFLGVEKVQGSDNGNTILGSNGADSLTGGAGPDVLVGKSGGDVLKGGANNDTLYGGDQTGGTIAGMDDGADKDLLSGEAGDDTIYAGYGDDADGGASASFGDRLFISFLGASAGVTANFNLGTTQVIGGGTITGFESLGGVTGSNFDDVISMGSDSPYTNFPTVHGMGGNDYILGGYYTGGIYGDDGDDVLDGRGSIYGPLMDGGAGNDVIYDTSNSSTMYGRDGDDTINAHGTAYGGAGNDHINRLFSYYSNAAFGEDGDDVITVTGGGSGFLTGGAGSDVLTGDIAADTLFSAGVASTAQIQGDDAGAEHDILSGGGGDDMLAAGYGDDVDGGAGVDTLRLSLAGATSGVTLDLASLISAQPFTLGGGTIQNIETLSFLRASQFNDTLTIGALPYQVVVDADAGDDTIIAGSTSANVLGGAGNDTFSGGVSADWFDGGAGNDTAVFSGQRSAYVISARVGGGFTVAGAGSTDTFTSVELLQFSDMTISTASVVVDTPVTGGPLYNGVFAGGAGVDIFTGTLGFDTASGGGGDDKLDGAAGADALSGNGGADLLNGGDNDDVLYSGDKTGSFVRPYFGNSFTAPTLDTGTEVDTLNGGAGNDTLFAGYGDNVDGGTGTDLLYISFMGASSGVTADFTKSSQTFGGGTITGVELIGWLQGSDFDDDLTVLSDFTSGPVFGMGGNDHLVGSYYTIYISGGDGDDVVDGRADSYGGVLDGGTGNDVIYDNSNPTRLYGQEGDDTLYAYGTAFGGTGNDRIVKLAGSYSGSAFGEEGDDVITASNAGELLDGGVGNDTADYSATTGAGVTVNLNLSGPQNVDPYGADTLVSIENLIGSKFNDSLTGNALDNFIEGGAGNDGLVGGGGLDTASYAGAASGVTVSLALGAQQNTLGAGLDTLSGFENLAGSAFNDTLTGDGGDNVITGAAGNDAIDGGAGSDTAVYGGQWRDYAITANPGGSYTVSGGADGTDTLTNVETLQFANGAFAIGSAVNDAPVGADDAGAVTEAGGAANAVAGTPSAAGNVLANDSDPDTALGDTVMVTGARAGAEGAGAGLTAVVGATVLAGLYGTLTINPNGTYSYTLDNNDADTQGLAAGASALESFTYQLTDFHGLTDLAQLTITVKGTNDAAVVSSASVNRTETNLAADISAAGVLTITDVDSPATFVVQTNVAGAYGAFSIGAGGAWTYVALSAHDEFVAGQTYTDTFAVSAADGTQTSVTVSILGTNDAPVIAGTTTLSVSEDGVQTATGQLTATDPDTGATTAWSVTGAASGTYGAFAVNAAGQWTYSLNNVAAQSLTAAQHIVETYAVKADDGLGGVTTQLVSVTINGANDAPVITGAVSGSVTEDSAQTATGQLTATDADTGATAAWSVVGAASGTYGSFAVGATGQWTYTLNNAAAQSLTAANHIAETYTVQADDGLGGVTNQIVSVTINGANDAPVITGVASGAVTEDGTQTASGQLVSTDADAGATATWSVTGSASGTYGAFAVNAAGLWTYTLNNAAAQALTAAQHIVETYTVKADDGLGGVTTQVVSVTINGADEAPSGIVGTAGADILTGTSGADSIFGLGGDDTLTGGAGADTIDGGTGIDTVSYAGSAAAVQIGYSSGPQTYNGAGGDAQGDVLTNVENFIGSNFNDTLIGASGVANVLRGGAGNDYLDGGNGSGDTASYAGAASAVTVSLLVGQQNTFGAGTDTLVDIENLTGSDFNDTLTGTASANVLIGGLGNDKLHPYAGDDTLDGGAGVDTVNYTLTPGAVTVNLAVAGPQNTGQGLMTLIGIENLTGSNFNDTLRGDANANTLIGGAGDDVIEGGLGTDLLDGGAGIDTASYAGASAGVVVSLAVAGLQTTGVTGKDTLTSIENLTGSAFNDTLTGDGGANVLTGGLGNDTLNGGAGNDTAVYSGNWQNYVITSNGGGYTVAGADGTDTLTGIETLQFANASFAPGSPPPPPTFVAPVGVNDAASVSEAGGVANATPGTPNTSGSVLTNDTDADAGDSLSVTGARTGTEAGGGALTAVAGATVLIGTYGALTINPNGTYIYALNNADPDTQGLAAGATGQDVFTYQVTDSHGLSDMAQLVVSVTGSDDTSVPTSATVSLVETNLASDLAASGQLSAADVDGSTGFVAQANVAGTYGAFSIAANGAWTYTAASAHDEFVGGQTYSDTFAVTTADGVATSVTVQILGTNDGPLIVPGNTTGSVTEDGTQSAAGQLSATDPDQGASATWSFVGPFTPGYGTFAISASGQWTYSLNNTAAQPLTAASQVVENFVVEVLDGQGGSQQTIVSVTINGADEPKVPLVGTAGDDIFKLTQAQVDGYSLIDGAGGFDRIVLASSGAIDLSAVTLIGIARIVGTAGNDMITGSAAGEVIQAGSGNDTIDGGGGVDTALMPQLRSNYTVIQLADGSLQLSSALGVQTYKNVELFQFETTLTAAQLLQNQPATIGGQTSGSVTESATQAAGAGVSGQLTISDVDSPTTFQLTTSVAAYGTASINATGLWTYVANETLAAVDSLRAGDVLADSFVVHSADGTAQTIAITINGSNDAPKITGAAAGAVTEDGALSATGQLSASDPDIGAAAAWSVLGAASGAYGAFAVNAAGQWTYTLNNAAAQGLASSDHIVETYTVKADDGLGGTATQLVTITINGADENTVGTAGADTLTGGAGNDTFSGLGGNDTIKGNGGDDLIDGGLGNDNLDGGAGIDTLSYASATSYVIVSLAVHAAQNTVGAGTDTLNAFENLTGSGFDDSLRGDANNNVIVGGMGSDKIYGDLGADSLYGGSGADTFVYGGINASTVALAGRDTIFDFARAQGDHIDVSGLDAITGGANDAFTFVAGGFTHVAGQLISVFVVDHYEVQGDVDGDGVADFAINVLSGVALAAQDFIL